MATSEPRDDQPHRGPAWALVGVLFVLAAMLALAGTAQSQSETQPAPLASPSPSDFVESAITLTVGDIGQFAKAPAAQVLRVQPDGMSVLLQEGFDGTWPSPGWATVPHWGPSTCRALSGAKSAWVEGGSGLPCGSLYHNNENGFLIYGPVSLADATAGSLEIMEWQNGYGWLCRMASLDGRNFGGLCTMGNTHGWIPRALDLTVVPGWGNVTGRAAVWIALAWSTGSSGVSPEGAYVDDVRLLKRVGGPTVTPTATTDEEPTWTPSPTLTPVVFPSPSWRWAPETVANSSNRETTSLAFDKTGRPRISFYSSFYLDLARWDGARWQVETVDGNSFVGEFSSLTLDNADRPHLAYYDGFTNKNLKYARWDGATWQKETVDSTGDVGKGVSLALDADGHPHISYLSGSSQVKYAYGDGTSWHIAVVDDDVSWGGATTSLALDKNGRPHITYYGGSLVYAYWDGVSWHKTTVDGGWEAGKYSSLRLDASDRPRVAYYAPADGYEGTLRYAWLESSTWHSETVDSEGEVGKYVSLALDAAGGPHIAYEREWDWSHAALKYAYRDGLSWQKEWVDVSNVGKGASIALNASARPCISYYDMGAYDLKYACRRGEMPTPTRTATPLRTPTPVRPPDQVDSYAPDLAPAAGGAVMAVWYDNRFGTGYYPNDVFAQRFGPQGSRIWPNDVRVSLNPETVGQGYKPEPSIATDAAGASLVAWENYGTSLAQLLNPDGGHLWYTDTVIYGWPHNSEKPKVSLGPGGSWYAFWRTYWDACYGGPCPTIQLRRFGSGAWFEVREIRRMGYNLDLAVDAGGVSHIAWQEGRFDNEDCDIFGLTLDAAGNWLWLNPVRVNSDTGTAPQARPRVGVAANGDTYVVWADMRDGHWDIYAQKFDVTMAFRLWPQEVRVNSDATLTDQNEPDMVIGPDGNLYIVWTDTRGGVPNIYAQKLSPEGVRLWSQDVRVNAASAADWLSRPVVTLGTTGILYVAWESRLGTDNDILMQSLTTDGTRRWASDVAVEGVVKVATATPTPNPPLPSPTRRPTFTVTPTPTPTVTSTPNYTGTATATFTPGPTPALIWSRTGLTEPVYSLALSPNYASDRTMFAGGNGKIWKSVNGGATWTVSKAATGTVSALVVAPNYTVSPTIFASFWGDGLYRSTNGGASWARVQENAAILSLAIAPNYAVSPTVFFGSSDDWDYGVFRSRNGGDTWESKSTALFSVYSLAVSPAYGSDCTLYAGTGGILYKSTNCAESWVRVMGGPPLYFWGPLWPMVISPNYPNDNAYVFADATWLWGPCRWVSAGFDDVLALAISPQFATDRTIFAGSEGSGVLRSTDAGCTWTTVPNGLEDFNINALAATFAPAQTVFAGTDGGVWRTTVGTWMKWGAPGRLLVPDKGARVSVQFGGITLPETISATVSGAAVFPSGGRSYNVPLGNTTGDHGLRLKPAPGAVPGDNLTLDVWIDGMRLVREGIMGTDLFVPMLRKGN